MRIPTDEISEIGFASHNLYSLDEIPKPISFPISNTTEP